MANNTYSGSVSNQYSHYGEPSYRIELRSTDPNINDSKRSEITTLEPEAPGGESIYHFSVLLPAGGYEDYAIDPEGSEIIAQWHNTPDPGEEWTSPPLAIHTGAYHNKPDHYTLEVNWDARPISTIDTLNRETFDLGSFTKDKGKWIDWKIHVKWGWQLSQCPIIEIFKNNKEIFELKNHPNTTNDQQGVKMKLGIYKWDWAQNGPENASILKSRVIYYGNVSIQQYKDAD
jgi:hypothetical protein